MFQACSYDPASREVEINQINLPEFTPNHCPMAVATLDKVMSLRLQSQTDVHTQAVKYVQKYNFAFGMGVYENIVSIYQSSTVQCQGHVSD